MSARFIVDSQINVHLRVDIDVALIQLVEFKIVILVVMGSSPIGHPNRNPYDDMESRPSSVPWIAPRH